MQMPTVDFPAHFPAICRNLRLDQVITITTLLKEFSSLKASGCLKVSSHLYLDSFEVLLEPLAYIMTLSLRSGIFPSVGKKSIVKPIPKKD